MTEQELLSSLYSAVYEASRGEISYDQLVRVGNWELIFSAARHPGQLPVLKHALYIP